MRPDEPGPARPIDSPTRPDGPTSGAEPANQQNDDQAADLSHDAATPEPIAATRAATPPGDRDSTGITTVRGASREPGVTAEPVAGVDLDLARAIVAHSSRDGEWTNATAVAAHAAMADAVHARQDLANADRINAVSRQLQRPVTPAEIPENIFHERAVTAQMWDDALPHAPEQHRRHTP